MATHVSDASSGRFRGESSDELAVIAQRAQAFTNASGTAIALSEGDSDEIVCRARAGSSAPEVGTALPVEGTFTGLCIQSGSELRCEDAETDARVDPAAIRALGIRSILAIPIKGQARVVGVLAVFAPTAHAFTITHMAVLKTLANQIAAYLERKQREPAGSPPLPAPPVKAVAAPVTPPPAIAKKPAANSATPRPLSAVPMATPVRAGAVAKEIDPAPVSEKKKTDIREEPQKSKTNSWLAFKTLEAAGLGKRPSAGVLMIGAVGVLVVAVAVGLSLKLRKPMAPQAAAETSIPPVASPVTSGAPALVSADVPPTAWNTPPTPPVPSADDEAQPKREETVVLSKRPSRISRAKDNAVLASDDLAITLGNVPASGSLSNLAKPGSGSGSSKILMQSDLEPITVIKKVPPVYPLVARQHRMSGSVTVEGIVDKDGRISHLQLISGPPLFRDAAFAAVKQWVFKPARLNGRAIDQPTKIRLDFGAQ